MNAQVIPLRPRPVLARRPRSSSSVPPVPPVVPAVVVGWDAVRSLHLAHCDRCADAFASSRLSEVEEWADQHQCDRELVALLAAVTERRAA